MAEISLGRWQVRWLVAIAVAVAIPLCSVTAAPKKKPAPPAHFFPAGGQRGHAVTVTISGEVAEWPVEAWVDKPGIRVTALETKGQLKIEVAADVPAGICWMRLITDGGASAPRPFVIGTLPELVETEPNDLPDKPQPIAGGTVINGKLAKSGDIDGYQVRLQRGQTLVAAVQAQQVLGSPMDGILQVCRLLPRQGASIGTPQVEAFPLAQNHDDSTLDPLLAFVAPEEGDYLVRLFAQPAQPDSSIRFSGGEAYVYRLTLTTGPYVAQIFPPVLKSKEVTAVELLGWNLSAGMTKQEIPAAAVEMSGRSAEVFLPDAAGTVTLDRSEFSVATAPGEFTFPALLCGRWSQGGQVDTFSFRAEKGEDFSFAVACRAVGSPAFPQATIVDAAGKTLIENDGLANDAPRDFTLPFKANVAGAYQLRLTDIAALGGPRRTYRVTAEKVVPDFRLTLAAGNFVVPEEGTLEIPVTIERRGGCADPIQISVTGLPAGVVAEPVTSPGTGDAAKAIKLLVKRTGDLAATFQGPVQIVGVCDRQPPLKQTATFTVGLPGVRPLTDVWLTAAK